MSKTSREVVILREVIQEWTKALVEESKHNNLNFQALSGLIKAIHPAHIDMTEELGKAIVEKLHGPLVYHPMHKEWLAKSSTGPLRYQFGYGPYPGMIEIETRPDAHIRIALFSMNGERFWEGVIRPAPERMDGNNG